MQAGGIVGAIRSPAVQQQDVVQRAMPVLCVLNEGIQLIGCVARSELAELALRLQLGVQGLGQGLVRPGCAGQDQLAADIGRRDKGLRRRQTGKQQIGTRIGAGGQFDDGFASQALVMQPLLPAAGRRQGRDVVGALPPLRAAAKDEVQPGRRMGASQQQFAVRFEAGARVVQGLLAGMQGVEFAVDNDQVIARCGRGKGLVVQQYRAGIGEAVHQRVAGVIDGLAVWAGIAIVGHAKVHRRAAGRPDQRRALRDLQNGGELLSGFRAQQQAADGSRCHRKRDDVVDLGLALQKGSQMLADAAGGVDGREVIGVLAQQAVPDVGCGWLAFLVRGQGPAGGRGLRYTGGHATLQHVLEQRHRLRGATQTPLDERRRQCQPARGLGAQGFQRQPVAQALEQGVDLLRIPVVGALRGRLEHALDVAQQSARLQRVVRRRRQRMGAGREHAVDDVQVLACAFAQPDAAKARVAHTGQGPALGIEQNEVRCQGVRSTPPQACACIAGLALPGMQAQAANLGRHESDALPDGRIILEQLNNELEAAIQKRRMQMRAGQFGGQAGVGLQDGEYAVGGFVPAMRDGAESRAIVQADRAREALVVMPVEVGRARRDVQRRDLA
ncbi:hypothetical protein L573_1395 [Bordetella holmesii H620]|nr:hypothetical protein L573_1395 [Bordetella holmesii H620]